jgi:hypothetical protein
MKPGDLLCAIEIIPAYINWYGLGPRSGFIVKNDIIIFLDYSKIDKKIYKVLSKFGIVETLSTSLVEIKYETWRFIKD